MKKIAIIIFIFLIYSCDESNPIPVGSEEEIDINELEEIDLEVSQENILGEWEMVYNTNFLDLYGDGEREKFRLNKDSTVDWFGFYKWTSGNISEIKNSYGYYQLLPNNKIIYIACDGFVLSKEGWVTDRSRYIGNRIFKLTNKRMHILVNGTISYNGNTRKYSDTVFLARPGVNDLLIPKQWWTE